MSTSVEIEVESESCDCCKDCKMNKGATGPEQSKDAMQAELKKLLSETGTNGQADRQLQIDKLISTLAEMGD